MAVPYPAGLPQVLADRDYREQPPDTALRTEMDQGPAKVRRRFTAGVRPVTGRLDLSEAQVEILDGFYVTDLAGGTLRFDWVNSRNRVAGELRFVGPPVYTPLGGDRWRADLSLEIMP